MLDSKTQKAVNQTDEEQKKAESDSIKVGAGYAASQTAYNATQEAAKTFAKPDTYTGNRTLFDSGKAKVDAKTKLFQGGQKVIDSYTGDELVLTVKEAKALYGDNWARHLAESDHTKPLEQIFKDTRNNPWVTTDDIKAAANSEDNIRVASRKFNNAKRQRTNKEYVEDDDYLERHGVKLTTEGKSQALRDGEVAEKAINRQLRSSAVKNMVKTGHEAGMAGAQNAGITTLTMSGIMNTIAVIKGEKNCEEAIVDVAKDGGTAAVTGYAMGNGLTVAAQSLLSTSSKFIQGLAESNVPGKVITAVIVTGDTLKKWGEGEITTQECLVELGEKGLNLATAGYSMAVGQALIPIPIVGAAVGALVGSMLTSSYYHNLINTLQVKELEHQERQRIISECHAAAEKTKAFRKELESYLDSYFKEYKDCFDMALSSMRFSYAAGDVDGVITSANEITRQLGGQVKYETVKEFRTFLDNNSVDFF